MRPPPREEGRIKTRRRGTSPRTTRSGLAQPHYRCWNLCNVVRRRILWPDNRRHVSFVGYVEGLTLSVFFLRCLIHFRPVNHYAALKAIPPRNSIKRNNPQRRAPMICLIRIRDPKCELDHSQTLLAPSSFQQLSSSPRKFHRISSTIFSSYFVHTPRQTAKHRISSSILILAASTVFIAPSTSDVV